MNAAIGGARAWFQWALGVAFVVLVFALQTGYAITSAGVAGDLGLSIAQVGLVGTVYTWAFALAQCVSGSLLDRLGARRVLPLACLTVSAGAFLLAQATGPAMLVAANLLAALGASFGFIGAGFIGGQWFAPLRYGFMFALVQFVASLSAIAAQRVFGALIESMPWTALIRGLGALGIAIALAMFAFLRDRQVERATSGRGARAFVRDLWNELGRVVSVRGTLVNALIGGATMGTMLAIGVVWGPRILCAGGLPASRAFEVSSLAWAGLAFGAPTFAWLSDGMRSRKRPLAIACSLQLVAMVGILLRADAPAAEASAWFFAFGFMAGGAMLPFTVGAELAPLSSSSPRPIGTSAAVVNAVQFVVGGILMAVPGRMLESVVAVPVRVAADPLEHLGTGSLADYQSAVAILPLALAGGLLLCVFQRETYPRTRAAADA